MKIVLLGSGNVATHLGRALKDAGHEIIQVWSRTLENAQWLADNLKASYTDTITQLTSEADIYIVSVKDDHIAEVVSGFPYSNKIVIHTSGTSGLSINGISGVLYPLQTFSKQKPVDFSIIPIIIEGKDEHITELLSEIANSISVKVLPLTSAQRQSLHIAAVFASNFTNHLYAIANEILATERLAFDLLRPLIAETADKVQQSFPIDVQTGPAVRSDQTTLTKHLQSLEYNAVFKELYEKLSQSIINFEQKA